MNSQKEGEDSSNIIGGSENKNQIDNVSNQIDEGNSNPDAFKGELDQINRKINVSLEIKENFIHFSGIDSVDDELLIPYSSLVFFAVNNVESYILFNYSFAGQEQGLHIKFYPELKTKISDIYEKIQHNNMLNPAEEFNDEPEGENELFTAESFK